MKKEITKSDKPIQSNTEISTFKPKDDMSKWLDVAIQIRKLSPSDVAKACSEVYSDKKEQSWRQAYYNFVKVEGFKEWLLTEYAKHFKSELSAKAYARLHDRVDLEKDMSKIIEVIELVEGKKDGNNVAIQVNNFINKEKDEFGI